MRRVAILVTILTGCSWLFMESLPKKHDARTAEPRCTTATGWPLWDSLLFVGDTLGAVFAFRAADAASDLGEKPGNNIALGIGASVFAVGHLLSARDGFADASRCSAARRERDAALSDRARPRTRAPAPAPAPADAGVADAELIVDDANVVDASPDAVDASLQIRDNEEPPPRERN